MNNPPWRRAMRHNPGMDDGIKIAVHKMMFGPYVLAILVIICTMFALFSPHRNF
jgi:hypothetical protein